MSIGMVGALLVRIGIGRPDDILGDLSLMVILIEVNVKVGIDYRLIKCLLIVSCCDRLLLVF